MRGCGYVRLPFFWVANDIFDSITLTPSVASTCAPWSRRLVISSILPSLAASFSFSPRPYGKLIISKHPPFLYGICSKDLDPRTHTHSFLTDSTYIVHMRFTQAFLCRQHSSPSGHISQEIEHVSMHIHTVHTRTQFTTYSSLTHVHNTHTHTQCSRSIHCHMPTHHCPLIHKPSDFTGNRTHACII